MKMNWFLTVLAVGGMLACTGMAQGEILVQHLDDNIPSGAEGWSWLTTGTEVVTTFGLNDGGTLAYAVDDDVTIGAGLWYKTVTAADETEAATKGWKLTSNVRVVDSSAVAVNLSVQHFTGSTYYRMDFGEAGEGNDFVVGLGIGTGGPTYTIVGGLSTYHNCELVFDPVAGSADLFVDGTERLSDYTGVAHGLAAQVWWGATSNMRTGQANWNEVTLEIVSSSFMPGDLNDDGFVGGADLDIVRSFWGQNVTAGNKLKGDPSGDGFVGGDDLDEVRAHWGEGTPPAPGAVPEPSALTLVLGAILSLGLFRRHPTFAG